MDIRFRMSVAALVLTATRSAFAMHPLWSDLVPGPYDAGFHIVRLEDPSRSWGERASRPIAMAVWYPVAPDDVWAPMPFDDYVIAFSAKPDQYPSRLNNEEKEQLRAAYAAQSFGDVPRSNVDELLRTDTAAHRDRAPLTGRFPLVVFATGYRGSPLTHTVTFEYLATHGYVVVSLPSFGATPVGLTFDTHGQEEVARDLQTLLGGALTAENVDPAHVAAVGYSFGAGAALLAAMQDERFGAVVSIDGMPGWRHTIPIVRRSGWFDVAKLRAPLMHLNIEGDPFTEWSLIDSLVFSERFLFSFHEAEHHFFIANPVIASRVRGSFTGVQKRTYLTTCDLLLTFLDAYLKNDQDARQRLHAKTAPESYVVSRLEKALASPPSEDSLARMLLDPRRIDEALRLFDETLKVAGTSFVSEGMLRLVGDQLLEQKRSAEAVRVFAAMSRAYPRSCAWIGLGRALEASGQPSSAGSAYRQALSVDPDGVEARIRLERLKAQ